MSKIVFFGFMAHGHTNPTLGVVRELTARGHQVRYYSFEAFRERITAAGAEFIPCDPYIAEIQLSPANAARLGKDLAFSTQMLVDTTLALDNAILSEMTAFRPDCIVADSMALWGKAAALKLGIPFVSSTTTFAFNKHAAKVLGRESSGLFSLLRAIPKIQKQLKRLQAQGYPIKNILDILQNDDSVPTIVYTSPDFQPASKTFSPQVTFVGPSVRAAQSTFEKTRDVLVYLSMGTVNNNLLPLYKSCIEAFRLTDYQVVMSIGSAISPDALGPLPENIQVYPSVDQIAVLQKADVFVSHCGMNSASESLYHGVPLVVLPQTDEQKGVAHQILHYDVGLAPVQENGPCILAAAQTILDEPNFYINAKIMALGFRNCPGPKGAADKILAVCQSK